MRPIESRLTKLEGRAGGALAPFTVESLDGTREEVEARLADLRAAGENTIAHIVVPHVGESMNDYRRKVGLTPLDIPGWDTPCSLEDDQ